MMMRHQSLEYLSTRVTFSFSFNSPSHFAWFAVEVSNEASDSLIGLALIHGWQAKMVWMGSKWISKCFSKLHLDPRHISIHDQDWIVEDCLGHEGTPQPIACHTHDSHDHPRVYLHKPYHLLQPRVQSLPQSVYTNPSKNLPNKIHHKSSSTKDLSLLLMNVTTRFDILS